jgi:hypothetical protein
MAIALAACIGLLRFKLDNIKLNLARALAELTASSLH